MTAIVPSARMAQYRREQETVGREIARRAQRLVVERMDPFRPDDGWARLLLELIALIRGGRSISETLAMEMYRYLREQEEAGGQEPPQPNVPFPRDAVIGSMIYTGPRLARSLRRQEPSVSREALSTRVGVMVGRSAMRHALNGGREATHQAVVHDPSARGWARITDADPCKFCRMLAERGAVDKSSASAGALRQWHDGCACTVIAVFKGPGAGSARSRSRRGPDGLTDRQRAVIEQVRREMEGR